MLALVATPSLAQEAAAPSLDGPIVNVPPPETAVTVPVAPAAQTAPTLVIPDVAGEDPAPPPAEETAVRRSAPAPQAAAPVRAAPPAREATTAPDAAPVLAAAEPTAAPSEEAMTPPVMAVDPAPASADTSEEPARDNGIVSLVLTALLVLAAAIVAFVALRRRRPAAPRKAAAAAPLSEPAPRPVIASADPAPMAEPVPVLDRAPSRPLRSTGAAVPLPARLPESYEERSALLQRMIEAKPDRANPFTDRRARMRRARLILQSLGRRFDGAKPWIDLSDYPENWPELARQSQAPTPVRTRELEPA